MARGRKGRKQRRSRGDIHVREACAALKAGNTVSYMYHLSRVAKRRPRSVHHIARGAGGYARRDLMAMMDAAVRAA